MSPTRSETSAETVNAIERAQKVMDAKRAGLSYREIAAAVGVSQATAHAIVKREIAHAAAELFHTTEEHIHVSLARLEELHKQHWPAAVGYVDEDGNPVQPNLKSAVLIKELDESRRELLGLNAAKKIEVNVQVQVTQLAEAQTGAFPLVMERLEREGWTPDQLERAAYAIQLMQEQAGERLKALDAAPVEAEFEEVKGE